MSGSGPTPDPAPAFALLAAGSARRFGGSKLVADLLGKPLWRWAADAADSAGFKARWLILSRETAADIGPMAADWEIAINPDAGSGLATSIALAAHVAAPHPRLVIALADMPCVTPSLLGQLARAPGTAFTRYASGRPGVPAAFDASDFARLMRLNGDRGAAAIDWESATTMIDPPSTDTLLDVDTPADLDRAAAILARR